MGKTGTRQGEVVPAIGKTVPVNELSRELKGENGSQDRLETKREEVIEMIIFTPTGNKKGNGEGVEDATGTLKPLPKRTQTEQQWIARFTIHQGVSDTKQDR